MQIPLCSYTHLAFLINGIIDERPPTGLTFDEIHEAAEDGRFIEFLEERYGHIANFSMLRGSTREQMNAAFADASAALRGREARACVRCRGLCLAMAIVLEAIQQQFDVLPVPPPEPEPEEGPQDWWQDQ